MLIPVESEPPGYRIWDLERCCFCRTPTPLWTTLPDRSGGQQVACCEECSKRFRQKDVPRKSVWCDAERLTTPQPIWMGLVHMEPEREAAARAFIEWRKVHCEGKPSP